jgi:hypothetical protein
VQGEKIWDVHNAELEILGTGTVTSVTYVDNVATLTATYVAPTTGGPLLLPRAFPVETYGNVVYTTYTASACSFKLYNDTNNVRPEPPRVAQYVSDRFAVQGQNVEGWWHSLNADINPLGATVLATVFLDTSTVGTYTISGATFSGTNSKRDI